MHFLLIQYRYLILKILVGKNQIVLWVDAKTTQVINFKKTRPKTLSYKQSIATKIATTRKLPTTWKLPNKYKQRLLLKNYLKLNPKESFKAKLSSNFSKL